MEVESLSQQTAISMEAETAKIEEEEEEEEECSDLVDLMDEAKATGEVAPLFSILLEDQNRYGSMATSIKEEAVYALARSYCLSGKYNDVVSLLTGKACATFFDHITKAKCAKVVRGVLDLVCTLAPNELDMQAQVCQNVIQWCRAEKRTFLRQRVEAKLASVLFARREYGPAIAIIDSLLIELKKLDDKQLLVETHLIEARIHHGLRNVSKAKAALTASRTAANSIYVAPSLQASIDSMSGVLHCEERDYNTAHSYFLEAFEQLDQMDDRVKALPCLKYMMLCKILDSLGKALSLSAKGGVGAKSERRELDLSQMISVRQGVKYAGRDIEAMTAIAVAACKRSLHEFEATLESHKEELQSDLLIKHHLHLLKEQILESNLIRIVEPYSCVEIYHIAELIEMPIMDVEKKLSQMILDGKFQGILDQGKGQLIVYEEGSSDKAMEKGLDVIANMDKVVSSLFSRSKALRNMMA